jgi:cytochrome c oxidase subunit 2
MEGIIDLHHEIMFYLVVIITFVLWMLVRIVILFNSKVMPKPYSSVTHHTNLEWAWTLTPALILCTIAGPSFTLLYALDEINEPEYTVKVVGNQWYWTYHYDSSAPGELPFTDSVIQDCYLLQLEDLNAEKKLAFRLLETDNTVEIPVRKHMRILVTSSDVLHSWAIPSLGIKLDACPGRLNQVPLYIKRAGLYYGQCSEICGVLHGFMPIKINSFDLVSYRLKPSLLN